MHPPSLHLGKIHLPIYSVCAAIGLVGMLVLSQLTARRTRLDPDKVWDAVMAIVLATLFLSRALLIIGSYRLFTRQPWLVLSLPTVDDTGLLLTGVFAIAYLRWKRLPLLGFLDALAPCGALLWAFLSLGRWGEGTREGMPFRSGGVWPVELLSTLVAAFVCVGLLRAMRVARSPGHVCACGLMVTGVAVFVLDFLRLPSGLGAAGILDPVEWLGLAMIVWGAALAIAVPAASKTRDVDAV